MPPDRRKIRAYADAASNPYHNEIKAILTATHAMRSADRSSVLDLVTAMSTNISLWGVLEFAASSRENRLSETTKGLVVNLARLVRYLSVVAVREPRYIDDLISINDAILDGLRHQGSGPPGGHTDRMGTNTTS